MLSGMLTMKEDAIIKSAQGMIPFEEVNSLGGEFELEGGAVTTETKETPIAIKEDGSTAPPKGDKETSDVRDKEIEV